MVFDITSGLTQPFRGFFLRKRRAMPLETSHA